MAARVLSVDELPLAGRRVFVRVDFNVPLDGLEITDDTRIRAALPTIEYILEQGGRAVLASHLGRPKGQVVPELSLEPAAARLAELLGVGEVVLTDDCIGDGARKVVNDLRDGQVAVLENLRFHEAERQDDELFARELARLCDVYVNDAFGVVHRAHASVSALPKLVPERAAGFLVHKELEALGKLESNPEKPYIAILGGAKVSDKLGVLEALMQRVDALLIGGAMANTFLAAQGRELGRSLVENDKLALARSILAKAEERGIDLVLPTDVVVAPGIKAAEGEVVSVGNIPMARMALDIGPVTQADFAARARRAKSIFWNGPMGLFENPAFAGGTLAVAKAVGEATGFSVVGGGDSVAAIKQAGLERSFDHVSTGGGASLELLEGRVLPGVEVLRVRGEA